MGDLVYGVYNLANDKWLANDRVATGWFDINDIHSDSLDFEDDSKTFMFSFENNGFLHAMDWQVRNSTQTIFWFIDEAGYNDVNDLLLVGVTDLVPDFNNSCKLQYPMNARDRAMEKANG